MDISGPAEPASGAGWFFIALLLAIAAASDISGAGPGEGHGAAVAHADLHSDRETLLPVTGRAADPDTLVASAKAYLGALNKLLARPVGREGTASGRRLHSTEAI